MANKKKETSSKKVKKAIQPDANAAYQQTIDNHKQAAAHHIEAAKHHLEAAEQYAKGNHERAAHNSVLAYGHHTIAGEFISDDAKHHAQTLKQTNYGS
ncbi:MAG: hypothetical protein P4L41_07095 [Flavipsychrobacter sp.]|nr:hypothetical protein [Flavipsychrobacter sp.]